MWQFIGRIRWFFCGMLILAAAPAGLAQNEPQQLSISMMHGIMYPPGKWLPLRLDVTNNEQQTFSGHVSLPVRGGDGSVEFQVPVRVGALSRVQYVAYIYFPAEPLQSEVERRRNLTPPVTTAELRDASGARRWQEPLLAQPLGESDYPNRDPALTLVVTSAGDVIETIDAFDSANFVDMVRRTRGHNSTAWPQDALSFPHHPAALDATGVVVLSECDPDQFDAAQRETLLEFVRRGGVLVVSAPQVANTRSSWLADYLPVRLIGSRRMDRLHSQAGIELPFIEWVPVTEALPGDADDVVVLRDEHYVHAAYRDMGLGRIVFTSFPMSSLSDADENAVALWQQLLNPPYVPQDWDRTRLVHTTESGETHRDLILSRMIGRQVPPWGVAAGIAGLYVVTVLGAQVVMRGVARPRAFATTVAIAGVLTIGLLAAAMFRQQDQDPMSARIAVVDLSLEGGGIAHEAVAFVGAERETFALEAAGPDVAVRPMATFTPNDQPVIRLHPFSAPRAGIRMDSYQRVWQAMGGVSPEWRVTATGQFDAQGLQISVDNGLNTPLESPWLQWGTAQMPLGSALATGQSAARAQRRDAGGLLVSGEDNLRTEVLESLQSGDIWAMGSKENAQPPLLVGFIDGAALPSLIQPAEPIELESRSQALVRVPVRIEPTPPGQQVRIPASLMLPVVSRQSGMPYDASRQEWLPGTAVGRWLAGFRPPAEIGELQPVRITIDANINAPRHRMTLRRGQVRDGEPELNMAGPVIVEWTQPVGPRDITVELDPRDADADGTIWLMIDVERDAPPVPGELPSMWQFQWLRLAYDARVAG